MRQRLLFVTAAAALATAAAAGGTARAQNIAYDVTAGTAGGQNYGGTLGMDFDVSGAGIVVTHLGAFDSSSDGIFQPDAAAAPIPGTITVGIFNRDTQALVVGPVQITTADALLNGSRFEDIADVTLPAGNYLVAAKGYNALELNFNSGGADNLTNAQNTGGGLVSYVGGGRFESPVSADPLPFPNNTDGGPADRYNAGTFQFTAVPEPAAVGLLGLGGLGLLARRRRRRA